MSRPAFISGSVATQLRASSSESGLENEHAADVATGIVFEGTGLENLPLLGQAANIREMLFLELVELGLRELRHVRRPHEQDDHKRIKLGRCGRADR